ncbi:MULTISPECIES: hypothetical protein [Bacteroidota]|uniref:Uncharacterized protein n=1 Tax=Belliella baltica (strain DSM 15883 / CIP 108006 / LMG 21964 / BA134) TaxID=866536 RepID=I3Z998_BELBD|nr:MULTISPECIES: hypothetical protein [Bacteroidota]AFL85816.1 hypothetical protein Belba_3310 [Belliella baltica DSM 15883]NGM64821.1 hypothetical protein [Sphingobacterium sp. SGR-19]
METQNLNNLAPRKLVSFLSSLLTDDSFKKELEENTKKTLSNYGIHIEDSAIDELIKLPETEKFREAVAEFMEREKFAFPAQSNVQMGLPLAFAITVVFVFLPMTSSAKMKNVA